ncbi:MAG: trans-aconitate 2-methyltransferase [bacterium]
MIFDIRAQAAKYYDYIAQGFNDIPFYLQQVPNPDISILELGCGTGRVLVPLTGKCKYIYGIDLSAAMVARCTEKLNQARIPNSKATAVVGDITQFELGKPFEMIIAPYRVMQNLETDAEVSGLFRCIRNHLAKEGFCILNVFKPNREPEKLLTEWVANTDNLYAEYQLEDGILKCYDRRPRMDKQNLVLYPELIFRKYQADILVEEVILKIAMRCYYPEQFVELIASQGFHILDKWGGYAGEPYGEGPELVVKFRI